MTASDSGLEASRGKRWQAALIGALGYPALGALGRTWRWRVEGEEHFAEHPAVGSLPGDGVLARPHPAVGLLFPPSRRRRDHQRQLRRRVDGAGSSTGSGTRRRAARRRATPCARPSGRSGGWTRATRSGITVDGPRGPAHGGAARRRWMAKVTGNPILPFHVESSSLLDGAQLGRVADSLSVQPHRDGDGRAVLRSRPMPTMQAWRRHAVELEAPAERAEAEGAGPPGGADAGRLEPTLCRPPDAAGPSRVAGARRRARGGRGACQGARRRGGRTAERRRASSCCASIRASHVDGHRGHARARAR